MIPEGENAKLVIQAGSLNGNAVLYINGRRATVTPITANSTITLDVNAEALTAQAGTKNVLEIQIEGTGEDSNPSHFVTLLVKPAA